jgi:uncharacterized protein YbaA (DUF1428 family)
MKKKLEVMLIFIYRVPKKNHDAIVQLNKQIKNMLPIHGSLSTQFFYLRSTESVMDFLNITEIVSAKQDEEVWVEIQSYRDRKHRDETMAKR